MRAVKTVQPFNVYATAPIAVTALRRVMRFQCLEVCAKGQALPIQIHPAAVGDDLAFRERRGFAAPSAGASTFFGVSMPTMAA